MLGHTLMNAGLPRSMILNLLVVVLVLSVASVVWRCVWVSRGESVRGKRLLARTWKTATFVMAILLCVMVGCRREIPMDADVESSEEADALVGQLRITVQTVPVLEGESQDSYRDLVFPDVEGLPVGVMIAADSPLMPIVSQNRELTYVLWLNKWDSKRGAGDFYWETELESIADGGKILFDASECPLHHVKMSRGTVDYQYGLPTAELLKAMEADFSGGPGFVMGGCCPGPWKTTNGFRCDACVAAFKKWQSEFSKNHGNAKPAILLQGR